MKQLFIVIVLIANTFFSSYARDLQQEVAQAEDFYSLDYAAVAGDGGSAGGVSLVRVDALDIYDTKAQIYDIPSFFRYLFGLAVKKVDCRDTPSNKPTYYAAQEVYLNSIIRYDVSKKVISSNKIIFYYLDRQGIARDLAKAKREGNQNTDKDLLPFRFDSLVAFETSDGMIYYKDEIKEIYLR